MSVKYYHSKISIITIRRLLLNYPRQSMNPRHILISFCIGPENCNIADANNGNNNSNSNKNNNNSNNNHKNNNNNNNEGDDDNNNNNIMVNFSIEYKLPYKIKPLLKPYDTKSYAFGCIYQFFGKTVVLSDYVGTDCLLAYTGFHLTGQLAILKCRVKEFLKNNHELTDEFDK
ncbi:odorant receptor 13a-like [Vespula squamosa]|uniref:Odorant receptor 13a-like n=1 Tax=Vespula squamosa TaxID=30214 RepID=A0ABD2C919_VESSQ